jgi:hypothetical protein
MAVKDYAWLTDSTKFLAKGAESCSRIGLAVMQNNLEEMLGLKQTKFKNIMKMDREILVADVVKLSSAIEDARKMAFIKAVVNNRAFWDSCTVAAKNWLKQYRADRLEDSDDEEEAESDIEDSDDENDAESDIEDPPAARPLRDVWEEKDDEWVLEQLQSKASCNVGHWVYVHLVCQYDQIWKNNAHMASRPKEDEKWKLKYYIGETSNLYTRMEEHRSGTGTHTLKGAKVILLGAVQVPNQACGEAYEARLTRDFKNPSDGICKRYIAKFNAENPSWDRTREKELIATACLMDHVRPIF